MWADGHVTNPRGDGYWPGLRPLVENESHIEYPAVLLGTHPDSGKDIKVMAGRYGPYVTDGATHATIPKSTEPGSVTLDQALEWIAEKAAKGPAKKKGGRRKRS